MASVDAVPIKAIEEAARICLEIMFVKWCVRSAVGFFPADAHTISGFSA